MMPVDPDITIALGRIELDANVPIVPLRRRLDRSPIPSNPAGQIRSSPSARAIAVIGAFDAPVMWEIERPPPAVVELDRLRAGRVTQEETPVEIQIDRRTP